jgi:hypothetical protein
VAGEELKVPIGVPVETNADDAADSVESLRDRIMGASSEIKAMSGTLRQLRGTSDEVKAAKTALAAKIAVLRDGVSAASLALVKQGSSYDAVAQKEKKYLEQKKKAAAQLKESQAKTKQDTAQVTAAIGKAGGPVASLVGQFSSLKDVLGAAGGSAGLGLVTLAGAAAAAAVVAVGAAVAGAIYALGKFIILSGNAARSAGLLREAWSGTARNAANLGSQVDELANKLPTSKAALNDLAISLMKVKLGGQATVDAFNAIGQASAALGDEAGGKIKDFIERGRLLGRMRIDPREMLEGFGNLDFDDVARALATGTKTSIGAAQKALREGRVKLGDGAKALRDAMEAKFGGLNLRKMMSLEVMTEKFHEKLAGLTSGVNLEPLLKPMSELGKLFDTSTVTGGTLKLLVTAFGDGMVKVLTAGIPLAKAYFQGVVIGALQAYIVYLKLRNAVKDIFGDSEVVKKGDLLKLALTAGKVAALMLGAAFVVMGAVIAGSLAPIILVGAVMYGIVKAITATIKKVKELGGAFLDIAWGAIGKAIPAGLLDGLKLGASSLLKGVGEMAEDTKKKFKLVLGIASPSKEFRVLGRALPAGTEQGVDDGAPALARKVGAMVDVPAAPSGGGGSGGGGGARAPIVVHIHAGGASSATVAQMSDVSFLARLTKAVEDALVNAGLPVQA